MSVFIEVRALGGTHYVRAAEVIAVQYAEATKCTVLLAGGGSISCAEAAFPGEKPNRHRPPTTERDRPWRWKPLKSNA